LTAPAGTCTLNVWLIRDCRDGLLNRVRRQGRPRRRSQAPAGRIVRGTRQATRLLSKEPSMVWTVLVGISRSHTRRMRMRWCWMLNTANIRAIGLGNRCNYGLIYELPQPTPMLLAVHISSRPRGRSRRGNRHWHRKTTHRPLTRPWCYCGSSRRVVSNTSWRTIDAA
jgi:hypothetical protein